MVKIKSKPHGYKSIGENNFKMAALEKKTGWLYERINTIPVRKMWACL